MDDRVNSPPPGLPHPDSGHVAEELDRERRFNSLGSSLSTLRVLLVIAVQAYLLLGFSLLFVRPPSGAFYAAIFALAANSLLLAGCLIRFFVIRRKMLRLSSPRAKTRGQPPPAG